MTGETMPRLSAFDEFLFDREPELVWELYHENSKTSAHERHPYYLGHPSDAAVVAMMARLRTVKSYQDRRRVELRPAATDAARAIERQMRDRSSARTFGGGSIDIGELGTLLRCGYGISDANQDAIYPRPFRMVPSGGALYPLELYVVALRVSDLESGLYHFNPETEELADLSSGQEDDRFAACMIQPDLFRDAAVAILISAVFFRSTFKYGDRGYRFVLLEAGHLGQNVMLAARALGLDGVPIGGFLDRLVDAQLDLDGIQESVVYVLLVGGARSDDTTGPP
jgi:SagB-type dehydrogenase family enzyme